MGDHNPIPYTEVRMLDFEAGASTIDERSSVRIRYVTDPATGQTLYWPHNALWVYKSYSDACYAICMGYAYRP